MKGLDLKEPFQKAAVTVSAPGGARAANALPSSPFILQMMNETGKSHAFVLAVVSWVETPDPLACPQLKVHLFTEPGLAPNANPSVELL